MMMMIDELSEDILQLLQTFLSNDDYHYFLNSSKGLFGDLKRKTIFFHLHKERSLMYLKDTSFQNLLLSKVENGWNQIGIRYIGINLSQEIPIDLPICKLYVYDCKLPLQYWKNYKSIKCSLDLEKVIETPSFLDLKELDFFDGGGRVESYIDLRAFSHFTSLKVTDSTIKDITPLKNIPHLTLSKCEQITDFSVLSHQKVLKLLRCPGLTDVSSFRSIQKLELVDCLNISDISPLNGVYDLTLLRCPKIKDISGLGNHHRVYLYEIASGFDSLLHIPHVSLVDCDIEDLNVLRFAKSVHLCQCKKIISVSPLKTVKKIDVDTGTTGFSELRFVPDLFMGLEDESQMNNDFIASLNNKCLTLTNNSLPISSLSVFSSSIQHLTIGTSATFAKFINDGQGVLLKDLISLTLHSLPVVNLEGIGHIPKVRISKCCFLQTVRGLGRNRCVELDNCGNLEDVRCLTTVPIVTIKNCIKLKKKSCDCLGKVPRLKIIGL